MKSRIGESAPTEVKQEAEAPVENEELKISSGDDESVLDRGQWAWLMSSKIPMILVAWYDSAICLAVSTRHGPTASTVQRKFKGGREREVRTCPELIDYLQ